MRCVSAWADNHVCDFPVIHAYMKTGWRLVDGLNQPFGQVKIPTYLRKMGEARISYLFAFFCSPPLFLLRSQKNRLHLLDCEHRSC